MKEELKKFEKYLEGSMSEQERLAFEIEMDDNPETMKAYQDYKDMQQHLAVKGNKQNIELPDDDKGMRPSRIVLFVVLILILISAFLYFGKFFEKQVTPEQIYASEFSIPAMMLKTRGTGALTEYNKRGFEAFAEYKFDLVQQLLDTIGTEYDPAVQSQILLAQAISFAETDSYEESNVYFDFLRDKYPHMNATANWYEGLSHLKRGEVDQAKALLKRIPTNSSYFQRAKEIQGSI